MDEWRKYPNLANFQGLVWVEDEQQARAAYPAKYLDAQQIYSYVPEVNPDLCASHAAVYEQEGWVDPVQATEFFLSEAQAAGAKLQYSTEVEDLLVQSRAVTGLQTSQGAVHSDMVVLSNGIGVPALASKVACDVPLKYRPAVCLITNPMPKFLQNMVIARNIFALQRKDGRVLLAELFPPNQNAKEDTSEQNANRILGEASKVFPTLSQATISEFGKGLRPFPLDGHPIVGPVEDMAGVYILLSHSGMTLGPLLGRLAAEEITLQKPCPQLKYYRPIRDFSDKGAYVLSDSSNQELKV